MEDLEILNEEVSRYILTPSLLEEIINNLKNEVINNKEVLIRANEVDMKINKKQIKLENLINIIDSFKDKDCILEDDERNIIVYKGDPYLTLQICMQALTQRIKVLLVQSDFMLGVNEVLLKIFIQVLEKFNIFNLINYSKNYSKKYIDSVEKYFDNISVIGDTTMYQLFENEDKNIDFYPYHNIILYSDNDNFSKLKDAIYLYSINNQYEIEILYDEEIEDIIEAINLDATSDTVIILTVSEESKKIFKEKIINKKLYINENPFKNEINGNYNYLK